MLKAIAQQHGSFARADGTWWSLLDCRAPPDDAPRFSEAPAGSAHGRKLYTLKIADFESYAKEAAIPASARGAAAVRAVAVEGASQAVVKVSYEPTQERGGHVLYVGPITKGGETFYAREQRDLFIMYRPTDATLTTDAGWLYGTVSPSGVVTSAGRVATCMGCHASAPHGRLFGPRPSD